MTLLRHEMKKIKSKLQNLICSKCLIKHSHRNLSWIIDIVHWWNLLQLNRKRMLNSLRVHMKHQHQSLFQKMKRNNEKNSSKANHDSLTTKNSLRF